MTLKGMVHDLLEFKAILVSRSFLEPINQGSDDFGNVVVVECEIVITNLATFI